MQAVAHSASCFRFVGRPPELETIRHPAKYALEERSQVAVLRITLVGRHPPARQ